MTNDEQYDRTKWGMFYNGYKEVGQLQLQKKLEKFKNEMTEMVKMNKCEKMKHTQHLFYQTEWDEKTEMFKTPDILLKHTNHRHNNIKWNSDYTEYKNNTTKVFNCYFKRCELEYDEVKKFYEQRKLELEIVQKDQHKERANDKIKCPFCQADFSRTNLSRHKRTNKRCLLIQQN